jgi:hypothetical protein
MLDYVAFLFECGNDSGHPHRRDTTSRREDAKRQAPQVRLTLTLRSALVVVVMMMMPTRRRGRIMMVVMMVMVSLREFYLACGRLRQASVVCP